MKTGPIDLELFPCAGGFAMGFQRAGIDFDVSIEWMKDHCDSYKKNVGHRPIQMDVRDFLRMCQLGFRFEQGVRLIVADPPCTPWSRAGKREGLADERDMLEETCEIIRVLRPQAYLIGNVPGLDDGPNLHVVQRVIGSLAREGYCTADFARLDAANYSVPQHRIRPFWFGHLAGPCIQWPAPSHGDPKDLRGQGTLPGIAPLLPWVTCGQALAHLPPDEVGRPVRLRWRSQNSAQHGSVPEKPARVVGTSNLSDGNVLVEGATPGRKRKPKIVHRPTDAHNEPAKTITRNTHSDGCLLVNTRHAPAIASAPAPTLGAKSRGQSAEVITGDVRHVNENRKHAVVDHDEPAGTIRSGGNGHSAPEVIIESKHPGSSMDEPAMTLRGSDGGGANRTLKGSKRKRDEGRVGQGNRVGNPDAPGSTVTAKAARVGAGESHVLEWLWDRPATTVQRDERLGPPGHHDEYSIMSDANAVVISEKAAAILQGFPDGAVFVGETKKARWSQLGQAMPPPLAHAVANQVVEQLAKTAAAQVPTCFDPRPHVPHSNGVSRDRT